MPHANPTPFIAYASHLGARTPSSAAPLSHSNPATSSANTPYNEQQTTNDKPQTTNNDPSPTSPSALALFLQVLHIAMVVVSAIAQRMDSDLHCLTLLQGCEAINCLYSIIRIQLTIDRHPERITPAELRRLAKASRYINRLARQKLDFSPFTTDDNPPSTDNEQQATNNKQTSNPQSDNPHSEIRNPQLSLPRLNVSGLPSTPVCHSPGATLARTCQSLCRILKLLPDLQYDPSGTVPTLDLANPAALSPATLPLGARTPSSATTFPPTNPAAPSSNSPFNEQQTTSNEPSPAPRSSSPHSAFPIPHFIPAPT